MAHTSATPKKSFVIFFLIYPILGREADLHNQGIHCQTLESISCLFTNLLVIWYKDKVPNKLVFNKTSWVFLCHGTSLRWHTFHIEQYAKTNLFAFSAAVPRICSYMDGCLSLQELKLICFCVSFKYKYTCLWAKELLSFTALLKRRE